MIANTNRPVRVAQVVAGMVAAGLETWLMQVLRHIDRERFQLDFITNLPQDCFYDEEIRSLGSQIIRCPSPRRPWSYARSLKQALRENSPYDIVHSHLHLYSGFVLRAAKQAKVPVRIAHSHSDTSAQQARAKVMRRLYIRTCKRWLAGYATEGLAVSEPAGAAMFPGWDADPRWNVLYCGIDLEPFRSPIDKNAIRAQLGLPPDAFVLGHVGTFREPKNHTFLIDVAAEVMVREPRAHLLLLSDGPLRSQIQEKAKRLGIENRVVFTGFVDDPPTFLRGAMDAFVFPSHWEGLPLSVLEAQAAGLPCVLSDVITPEVAVVKPLVERLSLSKSSQQWADAVLGLARNTSQTVRDHAAEQIEASPFNIVRSVRALEEIYLSRVCRHGSCD